MRPASDAHRMGVALLQGGEAAVAAAEEAAKAAEEEEEAMRAFLPMQFGKKQQQAGMSLEAQHAQNAREVPSSDGDGVAPPIKAARKGKKGATAAPTISFGKNLGASIGAGKGLAVPAATPTLAALQESKRAEMAQAAEAARKRAAMPPPPKRIGASLPSRPTDAGVGGAEEADEDDEDDIGRPFRPILSQGRQVRATRPARCCHQALAAAAAGRRHPRQWGLRRRVRDRPSLVSMIQTT